MANIIKLEFGDELEFKHPVCSDCKGNTFNVEISENDDIILHCISCQNVIDFQIKSLHKINSENAALRERLTRLVEIETKYNELLFSVGKKYPGESRHETALRYIRESDFGTIAAAESGKIDRG